MVLVLAILLRRQRDGEHRHAGIEPRAHQTVDHGLRDELVAINAAVHDERRRRDGRISAGRRKIARQQGHLEGTGNVEYVDAIGRNDFAESFERTIDDVGVPAGFDEGKAGVCHSDPPWFGHVTQGDHVHPHAPQRDGSARSLPSGL